MNENNLNLWLLDEINEFVKSVSQRVMQRVGLMAGGQLPDEQLNMLQQQIVAPTISGMVNIILMQTLFLDNFNCGDHGDQTWSDAGEYVQEILKSYEEDMVDHVVDNVSQIFTSIQIQQGMPQNGGNIIM